MHDYTAECFPDDYPIVPLRNYPHLRPTRLRRIIRRRMAWLVEKLASGQGGNGGIFLRDELVALAQTFDVTVPDEQDRLVAERLRTQITRRERRPSFGQAFVAEARRVLEPEVWQRIADEARRVSESGKRSD